MRGAIPARDFCIRTLPPGDRVLALISGYFDDSETSGELLVLAGYVGYVNQWEYLERRWGEALEKHGVPYFHMREMADPNGVFAKWLPPEDHQAEVIEFFKDLVSAIRKSGLHLFSSAVWLNALERHNRENDLALEPYPLAAYSCLSLVAAHFHRLPVTAVFDRADKIDSKLAIARGYADSDPMFPGLCDLITSTPLARGLTSRTVPAMQPADFLAWEGRKAYLPMKQWQTLPDLPMGDRQARWQHYQEWTRSVTGKDPVLRKSLDALIDKIRTNAVVWDDDQFAVIHKARRGIWTQWGDE